MQKRAFFQNFTIIMLAVAIIVMSVGYATYAVPLKVTGTTTIPSAKWEVKFANVSTLPTTNVPESSITAPTLTDTTNLTFGVKLTANTTYEFTVDVMNNGTIPAKLSTFSLGGSKNSENFENTTNNLSYTDNGLTYKITYSNGEELKEGDELGVGSKTKLKISASYTPAQIADIPATDQVYVFDLDLNYVQAGN